MVNTGIALKILKFGLSYTEHVSKSLEAMLFCNKILCINVFTQYKHTYRRLWAFVCVKHTQTNASYLAMDISCMPSRAGCRSRSRGRALYRDASRAAAHVLGPPPLRGGDLELEGGVNVSL